jgi:serine/threonine-protein kinase
VQQAAKLKQRPIPISAALRLSVDLLDGLTASNPLFVEAEIAEDRLYGGLTPDFAWVTADGEALLLDLAVALAIAADPKLARLPHYLAYRSPERLTGNADARADVFAAGVMLWELLANRSQIPTTGRTDPRKGAKPLVRLDSLARSDGSVISKQLADVVARAVDMDPAGRFASPQEMADAIHALGTDRIAAMADVKAAVERLSQPAPAMKTPTGASTPKPPDKPAAVSPPAVDQPKVARLPPPKAPPKPAAPAVAAPSPPAPAAQEPKADQPPADEPTPAATAPTSITALFDDLVLPTEPEAAEAPTIAEVPRFESGPVADLLSSPSMKAVNTAARPVTTPSRPRRRLVLLISGVAVVLVAILAALVLTSSSNNPDLSWASKRNPFSRLQIFRSAPVDAGIDDASADGPDSGPPPAGTQSPRTAPVQPDGLGEPGGHDKVPPKKKPFMPTAI